jgi:hypothetical protein
MKKETLREFTLITKKGRYYNDVVAKDRDEATAIIDSYLERNDWVAKVWTNPISGKELLQPTKTLKEYKLNELLRNDLKEGKLKLSSAYSENKYSEGTAEYENNGEYICVNFEYDFSYTRSGYDIIPEFTIDVISIYDYEGDEYNNLDHDVTRLLANQIAEDINNDYDVERWANWGVDEDRLYFEDDTPAYPITL